MSPSPDDNLEATPDAQRAQNEVAAEAAERAPLPTETRYKAATFIETYTGRAFWPLNPKVEGLSIIDIAHALSNQCRYSGHVAFFYSVAQHCSLLAEWLAKRGGSPLDCLQILMHDAPEAYLVDVPRPVKQYMPEYRVWDHAVDAVIRKWMCWDFPRPSFQDEFDSRIIVDERRQLMSQSLNDWGHKLEPMGIVIEPWTPEEAEQTFLTQYAAYSHAYYGFHNYINHDWGIPVKVMFETSSDMPSREALDVSEVDVRGGVARIKVRGADGTFQRDRTKGNFPTPDFEWHHGKFFVKDREAA
jgi:hypothetical protein